MRYHDHLDTHRDGSISAEREFLMDEYRTRFGCAPPVSRLVGLSTLVANALLARAILLRRPLDEGQSGQGPEDSVRGAGAPEGMADPGFFAELSHHEVKIARISGG